MTRTIATAAVTLAVGIGTAGPVAANPDHGGHGRPSTYELVGDDGGSKFEGIGVDRHQKTFYVE